MFLKKLRLVLFFIFAICASKELSADPTWTELSPANSPAERRECAMAFDPISGNIILFGGNGPFNNFNDTWSWDGTNWTLLSPANSPSARLQASMAYDPATGQMILFGGQNGSGVLSDTWSWDGSNWTQLFPANSPSGRSLSSMAYDPSSGQLILFGGQDFVNFLSDTWNWDGTNWIQLSPANSPSGRFGHNMSFDSATGQFILFGGYSGVYENDTWNWNGTNWIQLSPANSPLGRYEGVMDYDAATGQLILFSGRNNSSNLGDTWNWDGTTWTQLNPDDSPSGRYGASMTFDQSTGQMILFGGFITSFGQLNDTWNWAVPCQSTPDWTLLSPATSPPDRSGAVMSYDQSSGQLILFGGSNSSSILNDTWNWDGTDWNQLTPVTSPPIRRQASMAFDPATGQNILFGGIGSSGFFGDTWNWDGTDWNQLSPANSPSARTFGAFFFDSATGQMLLFGGNDSTNFFGDTWLWDGTNWTQLSPANSPSARTLASMTFDPATGQMILFGGLDSTGYLSDTWNWDGTTWTQLSPSTTPVPRGGASMAFDQTTGQLILFGGQNANVKLSDTFSWDGTNWTSLPTMGLISRSQASMAYDLGTGQMILFGGVGNSNQTFSETYNWGTVSAVPVVTPTPSSQTICSGETTSILLSSNISGTSFSWTVVQNGVSGASSGSGTSIAQALTTTGNVAGTATYTVTPTSPTECVGSSVNVVVTVNPLPNVNANPVAQEICTGETATISLSSSMSGTTFSWTVIQNGVTGASSGSGDTISQALSITNPGNTGTALYTITPHSSLGCDGPTINAIVTVQPIPDVTATPSSQTINSGGTTSIQLTSNIADNFFWTVVQNGVSGATPDSGNVIAQTLTTTGNVAGTATYTVTPESESCTGDPITVVITVQPGGGQGPTPPQNFHGRVKGCVCCGKDSATHQLAWSVSTDPSVVAYHLYAKGRLIRTFSVNETHVSIHHRSCCKNYTYELTTINSDGAESTPVTVFLEKSCGS